MSSPGWLGPPSGLFLSADSKLHVVTWRLGADCDFRQFGPISHFVNAQHGTGFYFSQREAPRDSVAILGQLQLGLKVTAVVERAHDVSSGLVVIGNEGQGLECGLSIALTASGPLYGQN